MDRLIPTKGIVIFRDGGESTKGSLGLVTSSSTEQSQKYIKGVIDCMGTDMKYVIETADGKETTIDDGTKILADRSKCTKHTFNGTEYYIMSLRYVAGYFKSNE